MSALRLHRALYATGAIDEAIAIYARHATIAKQEDGDHVVLEIESDRPGRAERVGRELGNYALGLTVRAKKAAEQTAASPESTAEGAR